MKNILFVIPGVEDSTSMPFSKILLRNINHLGIRCDAHFSKSTFNIFKLLKNVREISCKLQEGNYDICVSQYGGYSAISSILASKLCNIPVVITFRGSDLNPPFFGLPPNEYLKQLFSNFCSHIAAFFASGCIFVSKKLQDRVFFCKKGTVIASGADFDFFVEQSMIESRKKLGFSQDAKIALFFSGSNRIVKNVKIAIKLKEFMNKKVPDIDFKIIDKYVNKEDLRLFFSAADCLVFLSRSEGCPTIIQEACAMNLPIVSLDVGGVKEILQNVSAHKIVPNNLEKIASAISCLTEKRKRSNGRKAIKKFYCAYANARRSVSFYQEIINSFKQKEH